SVSTGAAGVHWREGAEDVRPRGASHLDAAERALVERAREAVVHDQVAPGCLRLELDDGRPARRDERRLNVAVHSAANPPLGVHGGKALTEDVERGDEVRPTVSDEEPNRLACARLQGALAEQRAHTPVEDDVFRSLVARLLGSERLMTGRHRAARR